MPWDITAEAVWTTSASVFFGIFGCLIPYSLSLYSEMQLRHSAKHLLFVFHASLNIMRMNKLHNLDFRFNHLLTIYTLKARELSTFLHDERTLCILEIARTTKKH